MAKKKNKIKINQSDHDRLRHLCDHMDFIRSSCLAFDSGCLGEAKRIAVSVRVLLHDTNRSLSLLEQLGIKKYVKYLDSSFPNDPQNVASYNGLIGFKIGPSDVTFVPHFGGSPSSKVSFIRWWKAIIIDDRNGNTLTREDVILCAANQDGGAHVDPGLDESYARIARDNSLNWFGGCGDVSGPITNPELFSIRQIAFELIESLKVFEEQAKNALTK